MRTTVFFQFQPYSCSEGHIASCSEGHFLSIGKTRMRTSDMRNDTPKKTSENFVKVCYKSQKVFPNFSYLKKRRMKLVFVHYIS